MFHYIWCRVTKEHHRNKTIYKGREFTPFGFKHSHYWLGCKYMVLYYTLISNSKKAFPQRIAFKRLFGQPQPLILCHSNLALSLSTSSLNMDFSLNSVKLINNRQQSSLCCTRPVSHSQFLVTSTIKQQPWEQYHVNVKTIWIITVIINHCMFSKRVSM